MKETEQIHDELRKTAPGIPFPAPKTPFVVPQGYFSKLPESIMSAIKAESPTEKKPARIISLKYRFLTGVAAAAVLTGVIIFSAYFFANRNTADISKDPQAWVSNEIRKVSDDKLNNFIELTAKTAASNDAAEGLAWNSQEIASLVSDIPNEEIKSLLNDVADEDGSIGISYE